MTNGIDKREYALGTYIVSRMPWGVNVGGRALCPDGIVRTLSRIAITADTFFSTPAAVKVRGKTVSGYVTMVDLNNPTISTHQDDTLLAVQFKPYEYRKNCTVFAYGEFVDLWQIEWDAKYNPPDMHRAQWCSMRESKRILLFRKPVPIKIKKDVVGPAISSKRFGRGYIDEV